MRLRKGHKVRWGTMGRGAVCERIGVIVAEVKAGGDPEKSVPKEYAMVALRMARIKRHPVVSFLVYSEDTGHVYWPDPMRLKKI